MDEWVVNGLVGVVVNGWVGVAVVHGLVGVAVVCGLTRILPQMLENYSRCC